MVTELFASKQDYVLALVYYLQAKRVASTALRLPEPLGERVVTFGRAEKAGVLSLGIFGDSAAAGVGVDSQDEAPLGQIGRLLSQQMDVQVYTELHATSGHTSFDLLHRLYAMPVRHFEVVIVSIGVNDVIRATSDKAWADNLERIITLFRRKFGVSCVIFLSLPPMHLAPSLPTPLNGLIGRRAAALSDILEQICQQNRAYYVHDEFDQTALDRQEMFAKDGFHPSHATYEIWAKTLSSYVVRLRQSDLI